MKSKITFLTIIFLLSTIPAFIHAQSGYKVIANSSVTIDEMSKKEISNLFLKKDKQWADGSLVLPTDLNSNSSTREKFTEDVHKKNINAIKAYWQKQIFSGRNIPPVEKNSDAEVLAYVKANPGAIGYVSIGSSTDGVKIIKVN